jgi:hypothetical protein
MTNPTKKKRTTPDNSENNLIMTPSSSSTNWYIKIEQGGLDYIQKKKWYLAISATFLIYILVVEVLTIALFLRSLNLNPEYLWRVQYSIFIKSFGSLFIIFLSLFQLLFLFGWRRKLRVFIKQREFFHNQMSDNSEELREIVHIPDKTISLTRLFYDIVVHMEKIRKLFILFNFVALYILIIATRIFWFNSRPFNFDDRYFPLMGWLNRFSSIILLFYVGFEWFHFLKWNRKFSQLRAFEKQVYEELDL